MIGLRLFYFPTKRAIHIGRTNIAGCQSECGMTLVHGQPYTLQKPSTGLCHKCRQEIESLNHPRGLRA